MDENKQGGGRPTIDKEYLKKLAEKIKAEKARKESLQQQKKSENDLIPPPLNAISPKFLENDDEEEDMAAEKTAIIDLTALSGRSSDARLVILDGKDAGKSIDISRDEIFVGRSLDNDFVISDISVSRKHFKVSKENDHFVVSDMGSGNGIKIDGAKVLSKTLYNDDVITAGARQIKFEILNPAMKEKYAKKSGVPTKENLTKSNAHEQEDDFDEPKKRNSSLIWIVLILIVVAGVAFYFFSSTTSESSSNQAKSTSSEFGEANKTEILTLLQEKRLKEANKLLQSSYNNVSGDNPNKIWLKDQLVLVAKELTIQTSFERGKSLFEQKNPEGEKLLKTIPVGSLFYNDAQALLKTAAPQETSAEKPEEKQSSSAKSDKKPEEGRQSAAKPEPNKTNDIEKAIDLYLSKDFDSAVQSLDRAINSSDKSVSQKAKMLKIEIQKFKRNWAAEKNDNKIQKLIEIDEKISNGKLKSEIKALKVAAPKRVEKKVEKRTKKRETASRAKSTMSDSEAKKLYMKARTLREENPSEARDLLQKILDSTDASSDYNRKAKKLMKKL